MNSPVLGVPIRHEEYVDTLLEGLPSDYAPVISVIESKKRTLSNAEIEALLYGHKTRLVHYNRDTQVLTSPSLNYTQGYLHSNSYKSGDSSGSRGVYGCSNGGLGNPSDRGVGHSGSGRGCSGGRFANFHCQIYLKYRHTANVCHFQSLTFFDPTTLQPIPHLSISTRSPNTWINPNSKTVAQPTNQPSAMLTNSSSYGNGQASSTWIPDFGASFHVTGESQHIKQFAHFDGPDQIFIGNGEGLSISSVGSSSFVSPNDSHITFKLHKLLHVPSISKNLLSVSQFAKDNFVFFEFHPYLCLVKSQMTNKILLQSVVGVDGLYSFHNIRLQDHSPQLLSTSISTSIPAPTVNKNSSVASSSVISPPSTVSLWHARLGHPNSHVMKLVFNQCNISSSNKFFSDFCASCCMGKSHRLPSHSGFKYYVSFIDAFSRYTWIFPIKTKAETTYVFQAFKSMVKLQLNTKIKSVQSD